MAILTEVTCYLLTLIVLDISFVMIVLGFLN
ncbi:hypothetical protein LINPERPRIM_LOCUS13947 [Linum perenne]